MSNRLQEWPSVTDGWGPQWAVECVPQRQGEGRVCPTDDQKECLPAPKLLSPGIPTLMSAWGVFTDFFLTNVYSQIVLPSVTK